MKSVSCEFPGKRRSIKRNIRIKQTNFSNRSEVYSRNRIFELFKIQHYSTTFLLFKEYLIGITEGFISTENRIHCAALFFPIRITFFVIYTSTKGNFLNLFRNAKTSNNFESPSILPSVTRNPFYMVLFLRNFFTYIIKSRSSKL